jgi:hypothetical protein
MPALPPAVTAQLRRDHINGSEESAAAEVALRPLQATILYVDDEPDALAVLGWFLSGEGWEVVAAEHSDHSLHSLVPAL